MYMYVYINKDINRYKDIYIYSMWKDSTFPLFLFCVSDVVFVTFFFSSLLFTKKKRHDKNELRSVFRYNVVCMCVCLH